jgi:hypothetical protein
MDVAARVMVVLPLCSESVTVLSISSGHVLAIGWRVTPPFSSEKDTT